MPMVFIEAPPGLPPAAKKQMMKKINAAVEEAYGIPDTMIFLRENSRENVAMNGRLLSERSRAPNPAR